MRIRTIALILLGIPLLAQENLPATAPLTMTGDLAAAMVNGIHHFLDGETAAAPQNRARFWHRDYTSPEAYAKSVDANRERLRVIIGAVDARAPFHAVQPAERHQCRLGDCQRSGLSHPCRSLAGL